MSRSPLALGHSSSAQQYPTFPEDKHLLKRAAFEMSLDVESPIFCFMARQMKDEPKYGRHGLCSYNILGFPESFSVLNSYLL